MSRAPLVFGWVVALLGVPLAAACFCVAGLLEGTRGTPWALAGVVVGLTSLAAVVPLATVTRRMRRR